ncbi:hypothetical protein EEL30_24645 [Brevibacillus laterosporus]|uniref:Lipoprotein n=1 Tax=Brevibacillus laterosporus TaxID=1465 RepID=A0A518VE03_BRELA|nr:hypothetical protein EEL30_24645 [Brevibacillus laterosporus]
MKTFKTKLPIFLAIFAMFALILAGCGAKQSGKDVAQEAFKKQISMNAYSFSGSLKFKVDATNEQLENDPQAKMVLDVLKNSELTYRGNQSLEPFQTELILDAKVNMQGVNTTFSVPMIMNQDKMWIKVPALGFLPGMEQLEGKYIELDYKEMKKMADAQGQPAAVPDFSPEAMKKQKEATVKLADTLFKHYGPEYFVEAKKEDIPNLPAEIKADRVINMKLTNENLVPFLKTTVDNVIPEVVKAMSETPAYKDILAQDSTQLEDMKKGLKDLSADIDKNKDLIKSNFNIQKGNSFVVVDKDNYIPYQLVDWDVKVSDKEDPDMGSIGISFILELKYSNFNVAPKWELALPKADEIIPLSQLMQGNL